ncbi:MAG TPA: NADH-quinone oxidoreductase subunit N [Thermodesulfovibrionales bacterium]|nr:NADH-quinone oxidoreductase subunit N [Thermodesulfovibrionales bacterium]
MTLADLFALSPLVAIAVAATAVMLSIAVSRSDRVAMAITVTGLGLSLVSIVPVSPLAPLRITPLLVLDRYALFYMALIVAASLFVAVLSYDYLKRRGSDRGEFCLLLLLATLGAAALVASTHFVSFFMALELLSVSLYALVAYQRREERSIEAGVKYLVLAAVSSAFLLFGMALIYAKSGTMEFSALSPQTGAGSGVAALSGLAMIIVGFGFKLGLVPFHLWTPDVYEGAPAPVTAFVATVSKGAVFALLLRYFASMDLHWSGAPGMIFTCIAIVSMFTGNLLALMQDNVKRVLAYSSIAHLGYLLVAFLSAGAMRTTAISYYLVAYFVTSLGAFGIVSILSGSERDADMMEDYRGLAFDRPWLAGAFTAMLLSLAGIPLTAGFIGKFYVAAAGAGSGLWTLLIMLVINSAIGLFYYLRILFALYSRPQERAGGLPPAVPASFGGGFVLAVLTVLLFWLGVYPAPLIGMIQNMSGPLH